MGEQTGIGWTDHTLNPVIGCVEKSAGCAHCYAKRSPPVRGHRSRGLELWGAHADRWQTSRWVCDLRAWVRAAARAGVRRRCFIASLSDVFEDHPVWSDVRPWLFAALECLVAIDVQLLTKRPENILRMVPPSWLKRWPAHVWIGTTVENQAAADERIPHLLGVPAAVRFLSVEPQIGPVDLSYWLDRQDVNDRWPARISWVICGGESGPRARQFDLEWARSLRDQCEDAGVPFFMKQLGARPLMRRDSAGMRMSGDHPEREWPEGTRFGTWPGDMGTERQGRHVFLSDSHGADESEWPTDLRGCRTFPEVHRG